MYVQGQTSLRISTNDTLTHIYFENTLVDTVLYLIIPNQQGDYKLEYENQNDSQHLHLQTEIVQFRDCKGLKIKCKGNCLQKNVGVLLQHRFPSQHPLFSSIFSPAYKQVFSNFQALDFQIDSSQSMLIISHSLFVSTLSEFVKEKIQNGINIHLLVAESNPSTKSIQNLITETYHSFKPDYVLLVGDDEHIPSYRMGEGLSDAHYTLIDGDDFFPEMIIGRISTQSVSDLQIQLKKISQREKTYFSARALLIASNHYSSQTGIYDWEHMKVVYNILQNKQFSSIFELYEDHLNNEENIPPSEKEILHRINQGISIVNYLGYGSYDAWQSGNFNHNSIEKINYTYEYPIVISAACLNGHFAERECFAEKWMNTSFENQACGASACLMFSSLVDWDAAALILQSFNYFLPPTSDNTSLGSIYLQTYIKTIVDLERSKDILTWIVFGDPSMFVYPDKTTDIKNTETYPLTIYPNPTTNKCFIHSNQPIEEIRIFDIYGKQIKYIQTKKREIECNLSSFSDGIYFIKVKLSNGESLTYKIVKNR